MVIFAFMKRNIEHINIEGFINSNIPADHKIADKIMLMDEYKLNPNRLYEFTVPENLIVELLSGSGYIIVNGTKHKVTAPCLISYLKGQHIVTRIAKHNTIQRGMFLSDDFLQNLYHSTLRFRDIRTAMLLNPILPLNEQQLAEIDMYVKVLRTIAAKPAHQNNSIAAKLATLTILHGAIFDSFSRAVEVETTRSPNVSAKFFTLLEQNFQTEHNVAYYAEKLNISRTYLYQNVVSTTGKSPSYWVDYYMISFAKRKLAELEMDVTQVALSLNFAGLPQFSKFFKKQTGISPQNYKKYLLK